MHAISTFIHSHTHIINLIIVDFLFFFPVLRRFTRAERILLLLLSMRMWALRSITAYIMIECSQIVLVKWNYIRNGDRASIQLRHDIEKVKQWTQWAPELNKMHMQSRDAMVLCTQKIAPDYILTALRCFIALICIFSEMEWNEAERNEEINVGEIKKSKKNNWIICWQMQGAEKKLEKNMNCVLGFRLFIISFNVQFPMVLIIIIELNCNVPCLLQWTSVIRLMKNERNVEKWTKQQLNWAI